MFEVIGDTHVREILGIPVATTVIDAISVEEEIGRVAVIVESVKNDENLGNEVDLI